MMRKPIRLEHTFACDVGWENLDGDGKQRHCSQCDRHLHNLSLYTEREAYRIAKGLMKEETFCAVFELEGDRIKFQPETPSRIPKFVGAAALALPLLAACDERSKPEAVSPQQEVVEPAIQEDPGAAALAAPPVDEIVNCSQEELAELQEAAKLSEERKEKQREARSALFEILEGGEVVEAALEPTVLEGDKFNLEETITRDRYPRVTMGKMKPRDIEPARGEDRINLWSE